MGWHTLFFDSQGSCVFVATSGAPSKIKRICHVCVYLSALLFFWGCVGPLSRRLGPKGLQAQLGQRFIIFSHRLNKGWDIVCCPTGVVTILCRPVRANCSPFRVNKYQARRRRSRYTEYRNTEICTQKPVYRNTDHRP